MSGVPGGADLERKNQYWIDLGVTRERERLMTFLDELYLYEYGRNLTLGKIMWLIKEKLK